MSEAEFKRIYNKYWWTVFSFAKKRLQNKVDWFYAEEVTSLVFIKLWQSQLQFDTEKNIKSWLMIATVHKALDVQKQKMYSSFDKITINEYLTTSNNDEEEFELSDVEADALNRVMELLKEFSQREKQIFDLYYIQELSPKKIIEILKTRPQTVHNQLTSLKKKIKQQLNNIKTIALW